MNEKGSFFTILLITSEYHMPRASHIFRSIFSAKGVELTVEEHSGNDSGWREKKNV